MSQSNIEAPFFIGVGKKVGNVYGFANLQTAAATGNTTDDTVHFNHPMSAYFSIGGAGFANVNPVNTLDVGTKFRVNENGPNVLVVDGTVIAIGFYGDGNLMTSVPNTTELQAAVIMTIQQQTLFNLQILIQVLYHLQMLVYVIPTQFIV